MSNVRTKSLAAIAAALTGCGDFSDKVFDAVSTPSDAIADAFLGQTYGCVGTPQNYIFIVQRTNDESAIGPKGRKGVDYSAEFSPETGELCEFRITNQNGEPVSVVCQNINRTNSDEASTILAMRAQIRGFCEGGLKTPNPARSVPDENAPGLAEFASEADELCKEQDENRIYSVQHRGRPDTTGGIVTHFTVFRLPSEDSGELYTYNLMGKSIVPHQIVGTNPTTLLGQMFGRPEAREYAQSFCNPPRP